MQRAVKITTNHMSDAGPDCMLLDLYNYNSGRVASRFANLIANTERKQQRDLPASRTVHVASLKLDVMVSWLCRRIAKAALVLFR